MTDRETRLRQRIDELADQRDDALAALWKTRDDLARARDARDKYRSRIYALEEQLQRWKTVALGERWGRAQGTSRRKSAEGTRA